VRWSRWLRPGSGVLKVARCPGLCFIVEPAAEAAPAFISSTELAPRGASSKIWGGAVIQCLVQPFIIIKLQVGRDRLAGLGHARIGFEMNLLILETAPEPLDEDAEPPAAVHADGNLVLTEHVGEVVVGELAVLVGVEDFGSFLA
jgi:hypothetical protein